MSTETLTKLFKLTQFDTTEKQYSWLTSLQKEVSQWIKNPPSITKKHKDQLIRMINKYKNHPIIKNHPTFTNLHENFLTETIKNGQDQQAVHPNPQHQGDVHANISGALVNKYQKHIDLELNKIGKSNQLDTVDESIALIKAESNKYPPQTADGNSSDANKSRIETYSNNYIKMFSARSTRTLTQFTTYLKATVDTPEAIINENQSKYFLLLDIILECANQNSCGQGLENRIAQGFYTHLQSKKKGNLSFLQIYMDNCNEYYMNKDEGLTRINSIILKHTWNNTQLREQIENTKINSYEDLSIELKNQIKAGVKKEIQIAVGNNTPLEHINITDTWLSEQVNIILANTWDDEPLNDFLADSIKDIIIAPHQKDQHSLRDKIRKTECIKELETNILTQELADIQMEYDETKGEFIETRNNSLRDTMHALQQEILQIKEKQQSPIFQQEKGKIETEITQLKQKIANIKRKIDGIQKQDELEQINAGLDQINKSEQNTSSELNRLYENNVEEWYQEVRTSMWWHEQNRIEKKSILVLPDDKYLDNKIASDDNNMDQKTVQEFIKHIAIEKFYCKQNRFDSTNNENNLSFSDYFDANICRKLIENIKFDDLNDTKIHECNLLMGALNGWTYVIDSIPEAQKATLFNKKFPVYNNNINTNKQISLLEIAIREGHIEFIQSLISSLQQADTTETLNLVGIDGLTPLEKAIEKNDIQLAKVILYAIDDPRFDRKNQYGKTPTQQANEKELNVIASEIAMATERITLKPKLVSAIKNQEVETIRRWFKANGNNQFEVNHNGAKITLAELAKKSCNNKMFVKFILSNKHNFNLTPQPIIHTIIDAVAENILTIIKSACIILAALIENIMITTATNLFLNISKFIIKKAHNLIGTNTTANGTLKTNISAQKTNSTSLKPTTQKIGNQESRDNSAKQKTMDPYNFSHNF